MLLIVGCSRVGKIKHVTTWGCSDHYQNGGLLLVFLNTDKTLWEAHLTRKKSKILVVDSQSDEFYHSFWSFGKEEDFCIGPQLSLLCYYRWEYMQRCKHLIISISGLIWLYFILSALLILESQRKCRGPSVVPGSGPELLESMGLIRLVTCVPSRPSRKGP